MRKKGGARKDGGTRKEILVETDNIDCCLSNVSIFQLYVTHQLHQTTIKQSNYFCKSIIIHKF